MKEQTEQEFYDRLNKIDDPNDYGWLLGHAICALSGGVICFIIGYLLGRLGG